ncbi:MAG: hypothetical protein ACTHK4_17040 [Mycobacteriales bacterium]
MSRLREWAEGLGWYLGPAIALLTLALLFFLLLLQSPNDRLLWLGTKVDGKEFLGTVSYDWHGQSYEIDVPGQATKSHVTVYVNASNPSQAILNSTTTRVIDGCVTLLPAAIGLCIAAAGVLRRRRHRLYATEAEVTFGTGLDPEFVARQLEQLRRPPT